MLAMLLIDFLASVPVCMPPNSIIERLCICSLARWLSTSTAPFTKTSGSRLPLLMPHRLPALVRAKVKSLAHLMLSHQVSSDVAGLIIEMMLKPLVDED